MNVERNALELREITGRAALLEQVYALRVQAWRTQVVLPADMTRWEDVVDASARHWAFLDQERVVAAVRLSLHGSLADMPHPEVYDGVFTVCPPGPIAYYSRAAVHPAYRRLGLLTEFHTICLRAAQGMGAETMICISGSVKANSFVGPALVGAGFTLMGQGQPYRSTQYEATTAPSVFVRWPNAAESSEANLAIEKIA